VLRPGSVDDISTMIDFARRFGLKIAARGEGHQPFGQAQVRGGIVIDMRSLQQVHTFTADSVEVDAGATPTSDRELVARGLAGNRVLYDLNRNGGGVLYPFAAIELTREDWRRHYGAQWRAIEQAKRRYDPDAVFASGPNLYFT
jgi:FAD/FMN-containing dehydrogenase